jgi:hypothetical protein
MLRKSDINSIVCAIDQCETLKKPLTDENLIQEYYKCFTKDYPTKKWPAGLLKGGRDEVLSFARQMLCQ